MALRIGVVGTGNIGAYHVNRLARQISGAEVGAVFDVATDRARAIGDSVGARTHSQAIDVVQDDNVDAVLIASPGELHTEQVLACIDADKPVLCEKPLATTTEDAVKVLEAEAVAGKQLVRVGFMRRYDRGHQQVKAAVDSGELGEPLLLHCSHRNPTVPDTFREFMAITDSVVHEIDTCRWLLGEEITSVTIRSGKKSPHAPAQDPQLVLFETESGVLIDVESFVNCQYGYDVRCELVGSQGYATLENPMLSSVTSSTSRTSRVPADWKERFDDAYGIELQGWVDSAATGDYSGANAWDGYAATAVATAAVTALNERRRVEVELVEKPTLYKTGR